MKLAPAFAIVLLSCAAPRQETPGSRLPPPDFRACGQVTGERGEAAPERLKVVVLWEMSSGTEEYSFKFGEAPVEDGRFCLTLGSPPSGALNSGRLGIAMLLVVDALSEVPEGRLPEKVLMRLVPFGFSEHSALVYVGAELGPGHGWVDQFSVGYGCAYTDRSQDLLRRMSCDALSITVKEGVQPPNWL